MLDVTMYHCEDTNAKNVYVCVTRISANKFFRCLLIAIKRRFSRSKFRSCNLDTIYKPSRYLEKTFLYVMWLIRWLSMLLLIIYLSIRYCWIRRLFYLSMRIEVRICSVNMQNKIRVRGWNKLPNTRITQYAYNYR